MMTPSEAVPLPHLETAAAAISQLEAAGMHSTFTADRSFAASSYSSISPHHILHTTSSTSSHHSRSDSHDLSRIIHEQSQLISQLLREKKHLAEENSNIRKQVQQVEERVRDVTQAIGLQQQTTPPPAMSAQQQSDNTSNPSSSMTVDPSTTSPSTTVLLSDTDSILTIIESNVRLIQEITRLRGVIEWIVKEVCVVLESVKEMMVVEVGEKDDAQKYSTAPSRIHASLQSIHDRLTRLTLSHQQAGNDHQPQQQQLLLSFISLPLHDIIEHYLQNTEVQEIIAHNFGMEIEELRKKEERKETQATEQVVMLEKQLNESMSLKDMQLIQAENQLKDLRQQFAFLMSENEVLKRSNMHRDNFDSPSSYRDQEKKYLTLIHEMKQAHLAELAALKEDEESSAHLLTTSTSLATEISESIPRSVLSSSSTSSSFSASNSAYSPSPPTSSKILSLTHDQLHTQYSHVYIAFTAAESRRHAANAKCHKLIQEKEGMKQLIVQYEREIERLGEVIRSMQALTAPYKIGAKPTSTKRKSLPSSSSVVKSTKSDSGSHKSSHPSSSPPPSTTIAAFTSTDSSHLHTPPSRGSRVLESSSTPYSGPVREDEKKGGDDGDGSVDVHGDHEYEEQDNHGTPHTPFTSSFLTSTKPLPKSKHSLSSPPLDAQTMPASSSSASSLSHLHASSRSLIAIADASKRTGYLHHKSPLPPHVALKNQTLLHSSHDTHQQQQQQHESRLSDDPHFVLSGSATPQKQAPSSLKKIRQQLQLQEQHA